MKEKIRDIIKNEKQFKQVLETAMENVGKERDQQIVGSMKNMNEADFCAMIANMKGDDIHVDLPGIDQPPVAIPLWKRTYMKVIAACIAAILVISLAQYVDVNTGSSQYASLFDTYNNFNEQTRKHLTEYKIGDDKRINGKGAKTTAAILEESAKLICTGNVSDTKAGVQNLKELLTLNYKPSLAPEIHWYLGMGYLKLNQPSDAKIELQSVKNAGKAHASEAAKVLEEIDN
ncbi:MAG: hypothetical protein MJZ32_12190 [Bacteroidaceae bacterium]|nr:hypothetical protein [Bacteroidaceae bacterium]